MIEHLEAHDPKGWVLRHSDKIFEHVQYWFTYNSGRTSLVAEWMNGNSRFYPGGMPGNEELLVVKWVIKFKSFPKKVDEYISFNGRYKKRKRRKSA